MRIAFKAELIKKLGRVALGEEPADLILSNGDVLNVYTGEILKEHQVLVAGDRIAYVGPERDFPTGPATEVIDVGGQVIIPGMLDAHIHADFWMGVKEFARFSLPGGTTTIITECNTFANAMGVRGVLFFLKQFQELPQRFFATAPMISFLCSGIGSGQRAIDVPEMVQLLERPEVLGLGEIYWPQLLNGDTDEGLVEVIEAAVSLGKTVEGHSAGAKKKKLAALAAQGMDSCHEPITAEEVRERLRLGLFTMIREGSVRRELDEVSKPLAGMNLNLRRAILISDAVWPDVLLDRGHMDYIVQKAIDLDLDPVTAIQMVTLNPAEHFHLADDLGGIAPGKCADLVVIPDLKTIRPGLVVCKGKPAAREGKMLVSPATIELPAGAYQCVNLPPVGPEFFHIAADSPTVRVRALELVTDIVNRETSLTLPVSNGEATAAGLEDVNKVAVLERYRGTGRCAKGFIKGYGLSRGALASSLSFDQGNLVVIGANDSDMAAAVNRIRELRGGIVYCCNGRVVAELAMPVLGYISELPGPEIAAKLSSLKQAVTEAGCRGENPLLTLFTITFTVIPSIRLLAGGYWLAKENRLADLFV